MRQISLLQARRILLAAQGLLTPPPVAPGAEAIKLAIRRMQALQIDTISVVARSPYLVLWSRLGDYEPRELDALLDRHEIFEHWSHAACFLSTEDYPYYRRMMLERLARGTTRLFMWSEANQPLLDAVLERVRDGGPVRSADFARTDGRKSGGWWDWKDEKIALELLLMRGDLMISGRRNFQRVYDLRERVLPAWEDSMAPSLDEARGKLIADVVRSLGIAKPQWVKTYLLNVSALSLAMVRAEMAAMARRDELMPVEVEGWSETLWMHPDNAWMLEQQPEGGGTTILSPFDPVTWDRRRVLELFGFDYRIECYTPAAARRYGYFSLPILHDSALVGRLDAKAHRREGFFEVKALHLEPGVEATEKLLVEMREVLRRLAAWHKTPELVVRASDLPGLE